MEDWRQRSAKSGGLGTAIHCLFFFFFVSGCSALLHAVCMLMILRYSVVTLLDGCVGRFTVAKIRHGTSFLLHCFVYHNP
jgi:hypothetical protein